MTPTPQIAFDDSSHAVLVWERVKTPSLPLDTDLDMTLTKQIEIAAAIYDVAANTWTAPVLLTDNTVHDFGPKLVRSGDGSLLLVWLADPSGDYFATDAPETLYAMRWNGNDWSAPTIVAADVPGIVDFSAAAHDANTAALLLARDLDGNPETENDVELFYSNWDGAAWSPLTQLTDDGVQDLSPTVFYDAAGALTSVWVRDNLLTARIGGWAAPAVTAPISTTGQVPAYAAVYNPAGDLVIFWQGGSPEGTDIYYAAYSAEHAAWSEQTQLTRDDALEREFAPVYTPDGALALAFARDQITYTAQVISPMLTISMPQVLQTDLYILRHTLGPDLILDDVALSTPNPTPGTAVTVTAVLRNGGDQPVEGAVVGFYDGDPGPTSLIGTQTFTRALAPAMTATVEIPWIAPLAPVSHTLAVVADPDALVEETNEANNHYTLTTILPALAVENVGVYYGADRAIYPIVMVRNAGVLTATNVAVELHRDAITGTLLLAGQIDMLEPGALASITTTLNAADFADGAALLVAAADTANVIPEFDSEENLGTGVIQVLPDLVVRSGDVTTATQGSDTLVTVTVRNQGVAGSTAFTVTLAAGGEVVADAPALASIPVAGLAPSAVTTLTAIVTGQPTGIYAFVDREDVIAEIENANNAAWSVGAP